MAESPDFDEGAGIAVSLSTTDLSATGLAKEATTSKDTSVQGISGQGGWPTSGLAKETGGNLDTHTRLLSGTSAGALLGTPGNTLAYEIASMLANGNNTGVAGGTPLLHGARQVFSITNQVIAAGGTFTQNNIPFTKPGYLFNIRAQMSAVGAVLPSVLCDLTWSVGPIANGATAEEQWFVPAGGSSAKRTTGRGPTKGDTLQLVLKNGDATDSVTVSVVIYETTHHMTRDDWRSDGGIGAATGSAITANSNALSLGNDSFSVPGNSTAFRNMPLYAGQANIWINQNVGAGSQVSIVPVGMFGPTQLNPIASLDWTAPPHQLVGMILPRAWCQLQAVNNAAGAVTFTFGITALEYAS